jgi:hypothetical protein
MIQKVLDEIFNAKNSWHGLIELSFLTPDMKEKYLTQICQ